MAQSAAGGDGGLGRVGQGRGVAVRAQHDAIRAGTRRSLRSERRDASAEGIARIRTTGDIARGVPSLSLSRRYYEPTVCSDGRSCFAFIEPQATWTGRGRVARDPAWYPAPNRGRELQLRFDPPGRGAFSLSFSFYLRMT